MKLSLRRALVLVSIILAYVGSAHLVASTQPQNADGQTRQGGKAKPAPPKRSSSMRRNGGQHSKMEIINHWDHLSIEYRSDESRNSIRGNTIDGIDFPPEHPVSVLRRSSPAISLVSQMLFILQAVLSMRVQLCKYALTGRITSAQLAALLFKFHMKSGRMAQRARRICDSKSNQYGGQSGMTPGYLLCELVAVEVASLHSLLPKIGHNPHLIKQPIKGELDNWWKGVPNLKERLSRVRKATLTQKNKHDHPFYYFMTEFAFKDITFMLNCLAYYHGHLQDSTYPFPQENFHQQLTSIDLSLQGLYYCDLTEEERTYLHQHYLNLRGRCVILSACHRSRGYEVSSNEKPRIVLVEVGIRPIYSSLGRPGTDASKYVNLTTVPEEQGNHHVPKEKKQLHEKARNYLSGRNSFKHRSRGPKGEPPSVDQPKGESQSADQPKGDSSTLERSNKGRAFGRKSLTSGGSFSMKKLFRSFSTKSQAR